MGESEPITDTDTTTTDQLPVPKKRGRPPGKKKRGGPIGRKHKKEKQGTYAYQRKRARRTTTVRRTVTANNTYIDANSNWAKARYRWVVQLLIRLGLKPDDLTDFMEEGVLEECFRDEVLSNHKLDINCIGWWDEVHKSCHIGDKREGATDHVQFPRDEDGKYNPKTGHYREDDEKRGVVLKVKYPEQTRWCFGVAITEDEAGQQVGSRLEAFDYTGQKILSLSDWNEMVDKEIRRVKSLPPGKKLSDWIESERLPNSAYLDDPLFKLGQANWKLVEGYGSKTFTKLNNVGMCTVGHAVALNDNDGRLHQLAQETKLTYQKIKWLTQWCTDNAIRTNAPISTFHHQAEHPYKSKDGDDWEDVIAKADGMKKFVSITKMVTHMVLETKKT